MHCHTSESWSRWRWRISSARTTPTTACCAFSALPARAYEYAQWKCAKVYPDYHIEVEHAYYSVPYSDVIANDKHACLSGSVARKPSIRSQATAILK